MLAVQHPCDKSIPNDGVREQNITVAQAKPKGVSGFMDVWE